MNIAHNDPHFYEIMKIKLVDGVNSQQDLNLIELRLQITGWKWLLLVRTQWRERGIRLPVTLYYRPGFDVLNSEATSITSTWVSGRGSDVAEFGVRCQRTPNSATW